MKKYIYPALLAAAMLTGCQDDWDAHYDQQADTQYGTQSLYEIIASHPELSDFRQVLDSARLFAGNRISATHYSKLLNEDQFLTVWAPVNGTFNRDSLLQMLTTTNGDSLVELHFLKNHIARYPQSSVTGQDRSIRMLNAKTIHMNGGNYGDASLREANIASRNGVLHIIDRPATYRYSVYEALYSLPEFSHVGNFLKSYQIDEFDETTSIPMGVVDGKTVYVDSVFYTLNRLYNYYGDISHEDSTYWMLVPPADIWQPLYEEASSYYQYGPVLKADSIHDFWTNYALLQDLVFNPHEQLSLRDSLCSTTWRQFTAGEQHVFYDAFGSNGLMSYVKDSLSCSNGTIYRLKTWPKMMRKSYFRKLTVQGEGNYYESYATKTLTVTRRYTSADSISGNGYIHLNPQQRYDKYYITYEVPNVLSGVYDVCVVMLPKTVFNPDYDPETDKAQFRSCKFNAEVYYMGLDGKEYSVASGNRYSYDPSLPGHYVKAEKNSDTSVPFLFDCNYNPNTASTRAFTSDPYRVDTIRLATIDFPACNYDQLKVSTRVKIVNNVGQKEVNSYNSEMFIDCVLLLPHQED